ncbi:MAG: DNA repair protein RecN [Clostridiales bacterium]|jgi:DNA repair protein RecN (Recombination protein N)|nr:DNA repair protein RecN [Clostridiales bacterium]
MLDMLRIKDVALIDELEINFGPGLNVLSGETGAGKSIIIDALSFVLGGRAAKDFIRTGAEAARVDALLSVNSPDVIRLLEGLGVQPDDDGALLLSRQMTADGRNTSRLNGKTVTAGLLKELSAVLIDIHSQHQHQSLLDADRHITLLDRFCGGDLAEYKARLAGVNNEYREALKAMTRISQSPEDMAAKIELYEYQVKEIEGAGLSPAEEDELLERRRLLNDSEKLIAASDRFLELLNDGDGSALDRLTDARGVIGGIAGYDERLEEMSGSLEGLCADLDDMIREFRKFAENLPQDAGELDDVEERLDALYRLKRKYGKTIPGIIAMCAETKEKLRLLQNSGEELERLNELAGFKRSEALAVCGRITDLRTAAAKKIQSEIEGALKDLGMKNARFEAGITEKDDFNADGLDRVEFMISPNPGEPMKPLARIASGGEMSRIMLALKSALADYDDIETFIFDEIDTGVSGRAAQMVAEKMARLGGSHQILCVTHLPQIAAMGDCNFLIEKHTAGGTTLTGVTALDRPGVIRELARLTGGAEITEATLKAADEMKGLADEVKGRG